MKVPFEGMNPQDLFESQLDLIEKVIEYVRRRHQLLGDRGDDFGSYAKLEIIDKDYAVLRKFRGKSRLQTYLTTVIHRLFLDYQIKRWGKWRPSAKAKKLGTVAVQLETLLSRDGHSLNEATEILKTNYQVATSREKLTEIATALPHRTSRRFESDERLADVTARDGAEQAVLDRERGDAARKIEAALGEAMESLGAEDRLVLKMRFEEGFTVAQIASALDLEQRPLYTRIEKSLKKLRDVLEQKGVSADQMGRILGWEISEIQVDFGMNSGKTHG